MDKYDGIVKSRVLISIILIATVLLCGCKHRHDAVPDAKKAAVYYWRTSLNLDDEERAFLKQHGVEKMFVRYFDVVLRGGSPMPNATITGLDSVPVGVEIVPTVFIVENCLQADTAHLAELLVARVAQMCETHNVSGVRELQIDCDWTASSMTTFYALLKNIRDYAAAKGWRTSATIRLHQLNMPPPPADYGALMVYNTGNVRKPDGTNPILDQNHVAPYLKFLDSYDLPLCAAFPCFEWNLLYDGHDFKAILYDAHLSDGSKYKKAGNGKYLAISSSDMPEYNSDGSAAVRINVGDSVIVARPGAEVILNTQRELAKHRPEINAQVILYSLNSKYLKLYNTDFYEKIYHN